MSDLTTAFAEAADALGIGTTSIVEKDYYVVELLRVLQPLQFESHQLVFAGGTALAKSGIDLNRMSEDVDINLVPRAGFPINSREQRKTIRKRIVSAVHQSIENSDLFLFDDTFPGKTLDEYRYNCLSVRYTQAFSQSPCLRPFIKLELVETEMFQAPEHRSITSLVFDFAQLGSPVEHFPLAAIATTRVEKLVTVMRRTAARIRNAEREDDESLVRHIYDHFKITEASGMDIDPLIELAQATIAKDAERYGNQHPQLRGAPIAELKLGLEEIGNNPIYEKRYMEFVTPMVFGTTQVSWRQAYERFHESAIALLAGLDQ